MSGGRLIFYLHQFNGFSVYIQYTICSKGEKTCLAFDFTWCLVDICAFLPYLKRGTFLKYPACIKRNEDGYH